MNQQALFARSIGRMNSLPPQPADEKQREFFLQDVTIVRLGGVTTFRHLDWTVHDGESWAIVGPVASGKTTLAETIRGRHRLETGVVGWPFVERLRAEGYAIAWPTDVIHLVSFKEDSWLFSYGRHFYQQRFNFIEPHDDLTLYAFLRSYISSLDDEIHAAAERLGLRECLPLSLIKLSNGQMRRARIAKALLSRPKLLILDEPFMGLDAAGRRDVAELLGNVLVDGVRLLLVTQPHAIPDWVTHVLELDRLAIRWQGPRSAYRAPALPPSEAPSAPRPAIAAAEPIIELRNVTVAYGGRPALHEVTWTVCAGERWAVLGPNGSGKTTLLSLLCGDHPQAYSNDIRLFGRQRGSGESIWDIKRRIGLLSPELHLYFTEPLSAAEVAATGFFDVLAYRSTTLAQNVIIAELFDHFRLTPLADRPFSRLSTGEQRLVLLVRALVKQPLLLILDEPFQGLDVDAISRGREWLEQRLRPEQSLLFVSHVVEEIPSCVSHRLRLEQGRIIELL
jgi:molybdate transport system ATP-binding protein